MKFFNNSSNTGKSKEACCIDHDIALFTMEREEVMKDEEHIEEDIGKEEVEEVQSLDSLSGQELQE